MTTDLHPLVETYAHALQSFGSVADGLAPGDWELATECPGWSVRDQVAHVVALELQLGGAALPSRLPAYGEHVRNDFGRHMEDGVAALRDLSTDALLERLAEAGEQHLSQLRAETLDPHRLVPGPVGTDVPLSGLLPLRVFDIWTHEQDVRRGVGHPGGLGGPAAQLSVLRMTAGLGRVVGKAVAPPAGTSVGFQGTGDVPVALTVTVGPDGRAADTPGIGADATVTLATTTETLMRLAAGRVDPATSAVEIVGDQGLGRVVLDHLSMTP